MVTYHSCHSGLGGAFRLEEITKSSYRGQAIKSWDHFLLRKLTPQDTM